MDWFERLTGFRETGYHDTRQKLSLVGRELHSRVNGRSYDVGELELVSLDALRRRVAAGGGLPGRLQVRVVTGDVRRLHQAPEFAGALFQVASQFNLLEMTGPDVSPEDGVTRYQCDHTQGPACAMAAGAATIYRNYFAPVGEATGQTRSNQLDGLREIGVALEAALGRPRRLLWLMRNGYALCSQEGLHAISRHLETSAPQAIEELSGRLQVGVHWDVEVTDLDANRSQRVSQAFCSALPVAYSQVPKDSWRLFASFVLGAAYEATLLAASLNAQRAASNVVLLTRLGGGAFGNADAWIDTAMRRALRRAVGLGLDVRLVSRGPPAPHLLELVDEFR